MIRKLRMKFISLSMFSLLLVLTVIMTCINLLNYESIVREADAILSLLSANNGAFPEPGKFKDEMDFKHMSPELPFETRYFCVFADSFGNILSTDTGKIAAVDEKTAIEYAGDVLTGEKTKGFLAGYRFICKSSHNQTMIIFLDCKRSLTTFRTFLLISSGISIFGLLTVLCLMIILSKQIVKPFSESYEKQKRFITDAGHELKTPLTIINADVDILEMDIGENEWLEDIQKQTLHLAELTNSLICLSRMEEDQNRFQMIDLPFSDLVNETAQSFQTLAKTQNKTFTSEITPMLSLCGDEKTLRQLITILLDNALKYSDENGIIALTMKKQGNAIVLSVYNTVTYISRENLKYIFDRFYRADPSRNSDTGGYGLGLSIAYTIVAAHKGKISASTQDEHSLLITVTLPAQTARKRTQTHL